MKNFTAYKLALEAATQLREPLTTIARRDADLGKQVRRAMGSVVLNLAEGSRRAGQDRTHHFRIAAGSAAEVQAGLDLAQAWAYVPPTATHVAAGRLDELLAVLYALTERRR